MGRVLPCVDVNHIPGVAYHPDRYIDESDEMRARCWFLFDTIDGNHDETMCDAPRLTTQPSSKSRRHLLTHCTAVCCARSFIELIKCVLIALAARSAILCLALRLVLLE